MRRTGRRAGRGARPEMRPAPRGLKRSNPLRPVERREAPPRLSVRLATGRDFRGRLGTEFATPSLLGAATTRAGLAGLRLPTAGLANPSGVSRRSIPLLGKRKKGPAVPTPRQ